MKKEKEELRRVTEKIQGQLNRYADKIIVSQYISEKEPVRNDGDTWLDREGKTWTMKNGTKQSISPLQDAKTPWWCPVCERVMKSIDTKAWRTTGKCYDCVAAEETELKMNGKFESHRRREMLKSQIHYFSDKLIELTYYHDTLTIPEFTTHNEKTGHILMVDKFTVDLDQVKADIRKECININELLTKFETELEELDANSDDEV
jgi:hypothetical protein